MNIRFTAKLSAGVILAALTFGVAAVRAQEFTAQAAVERQEVFAGESFQFQIQVSGSENPDQPDLAGLDGFSVRYLGGQKNSSQSISIVNGRMARETRLGFVFLYELTAQRAGTLVIPAIPVSAGGKTVQTQPVPIAVRKPMETDAIKLRMALSKTRCYAGEAVTLTVTWYLGQDVRGFEFNVPIVGNTDLFWANPKVDTSSGGPYYRIPLAGGEVIGAKGTGRLDGKDYATITFSKILIPRKPGPVAFEAATVSCDALVGHRERGGRPGVFGDDFMSSFFNDDFFGGRQGVYQRVTVPSNELVLDVLPLPAEGRPANFAGHVGAYRLETTAAPVDVNVGDPITLGILVSGPEYLEHVEFPPLQQQAALARDFKIPADMAAGKITGGGKLFTQTVRALRPDVTAIPAIELSYFDTEQGQYRTVRSAPIPLTVKAATVVTAEDAEGRDATTVRARALEAWTAGIAYNYDDDSLLTDERYGPDALRRSPMWLGIVVVPPAVYLVTLMLVWAVRRRNANPSAVRSRQAMGRLAHALRGVEHRAPDEAAQAVLEGMRHYLGAKLDMAAAALTYNDVSGRLAAAGIDQELLTELKRIFDESEAGRFAGGAHAMSKHELRERALTVARSLERSLP